MKRKINIKNLATIFCLLCLVLISKKTDLNIKEVKGEVKTDFKYKALAVTNDPLYNEQWALPNVKANEAWDVTKGSSNTVIAVLDTGVLVNHQDLSSKIWQNTDEISGNGIDDDSNGYIDDMNGWDFESRYWDEDLQQWYIGDNNVNPDNGGGSAVYHGTLVAGVAAGATNNGTGISGSCWNCKIMAVKVLDNEGSGTTDVIAEGIRYATDNGATVINMSFGYENEYGPDAYLSDAIDYAYARGVVLVAAAGNDGERVNYPGAYEKVLSVGAIDSNNTRASWSSYGSELDLVAPGVSLMTTYTYWNGSSYVANAYARASGTSLASPVVAGLAGLSKSAYSGKSNLYIMGKIKNWCNKLYLGTSTKDSYIGYGSSNFYSSLVNKFSIYSPTSNSIFSTNSLSLKAISEPGDVDIRVNNVSKTTQVVTDSGELFYTLNNLSVGANTVQIVHLDGSASKVFTIKYSTPVYRFWSNSKQKHFFTISSSEKNYVIANLNKVWSYEGIKFNAIPGTGGIIRPIYRFWSDQKQGHFYTISESEKNYIIANYPTWKYERIAYYGYQTQAANTIPVYRFWSESKQTHFYTTSWNEKNYIINNWPNIWKYERIAYYVPR